MGACWTTVPVEFDAGADAGRIVEIEALIAAEDSTEGEGPIMVGVVAAICSE